jgi:hypothetical protein
MRSPCCVNPPPHFIVFYAVRVIAGDCAQISRSGVFYRDPVCYVTASRQVWRVAAFPGGIASPVVERLLSTTALYSVYI